MTLEDMDTVDKAAMLLSTGLMFLGIVVLGLIELLDGTPHAPIVTNRAGKVVGTGTFGPEIRTGLVIAGLVVLLVYAVYKLVRPAGEAEETTGTETPVP